MTNYAYLDKSGIMHIVEKRETAENSKGQGIIVETDIKDDKGFPAAIYKGELGGIIVYSEDEMKVEATGNKIKDAKVLYPHLAELYRRCRG